MKKILTVSAAVFLCAAPAWAQTATAPATPQATAPVATATATATPTPIAPAKPVITVDDAYAFATSPDQKSGAIFLTVHNAGSGPDRLIGVATDIADSTEIHTTMQEEDNMVMIKNDSIDVPANGDVSFDPLSHHIMLIGLRAPLKVGDNMPLRLKFQVSGDMQVSAQVRAAGDVPSMTPSTTTTTDAPKQP